VRVAIFNYVHDPSGANTVHAVISIAGATMSASVRLEYLPVPTVVQKGGYTWTGQVRGFVSFLSPHILSTTRHPT
jgi:xanthine/uracil/vitamin C permease (AzgA family)